MDKSKTLDKKGVKDLVKNKGFFCSLKVDTEKNAPAQYAAQIPEGATYFEGIASNGEVNRNGYIIREKAWKNAINDFFANPIVLLQHNLDEPIGNALWAKVGKNGLAVGGYLFDEMTGGRLAKGLLKALSTGHITKAVEFENQETGKIITEEEYRAKRDSGEIGWNDQNWILAVTQLEWVEFSLVSIGSNRASFITRHDAIETYLKNGAITENGIAEILAKNGDEPEEKPEETPAEPEKKPEDENAEGEKVKISPEEKAKLDAAAKLAREALEALEKAQSETEVDEDEGEKGDEEKKEDDEKPAEKAGDDPKPEKADEKPAESEAENAEKPEGEGEKPAPESEKKEPEDAGKDGGGENKFDVPVEVKTAINAIVAENTSIRTERDELKEKVAKFEAEANKKGLIYSSQFGGGENSAKKPEAEKSAGKEKKSDGGKSAIDFFRANGVELE